MHDTGVPLNDAPGLFSTGEPATERDRETVRERERERERGNGAADEAAAAVAGFPPVFPVVARPVDARPRDEQVVESLPPPAAQPLTFK
jgi:hypothetical protein